MLNNYIKIALRNLLKNKAFSAINISGLSMGIACCLLLALYIQDEFSYDQHHQRLEDIYRVDTEFGGSFGFGKQNTISPPIAMTLKEEVPEVEAAARTVPFFAETLIKTGDQVFYEENGYYADSTFFDVLTYEFTEGNPKKALTSPNTVVLSRTLARKIFNDQPALDKSVTLILGESPVNYKVTGVFDEKNKSIITASFITSMLSGGQAKNTREDTEWGGNNYVTAFIKLVPGHSPDIVEKKINDVLIRHGSDALKALGMTKKLFIEPVSGIYLHSRVDKTPRIIFLYVVGAIAIFILLIACINFMNLSTAKAAKRATEIGLRKVMGAYRSSLIRQILGEAMLIVFFSILIGVLMVELSLPLFNEISGKAIVLGASNFGQFLVALILVAVITGLVAGSYPAFYLSSFAPAQTLKGKFHAGNTSGRLRQILVVFQFSIAIILVCGVIIIIKQLDYVKNKDLGFDAAAKIVLPLRTGNAKENYRMIKKELQKLSAVQSVAGSRFVPGSPIYNDMRYYPKGGNMENGTTIWRNKVDAGYLELLGIPLLAGRSFSENGGQDTSKLVLTKTAAEKLGFSPEEIIGQSLFFDWQGKKHSFEVIGVMGDFNHFSLREEMKPTLLENEGDSARYNYLLASVQPGSFQKTLSGIEAVWKSLVSDAPFEYTFLDDRIQNQYDQDRNISAIITGFTLIAIIICCLGLYGLSSFMAEQRFKEIGVRKVLGATVGQIVGMMSREFLKLVLIAFIIAVPLAWYIMNKWLNNFAYKIDIDLTIFMAAGLFAFLIALATVSYESVRAASTNPVNTLRNE
jgi:putative ABC transport system permease protein